MGSCTNDDSGLVCQYDLTGCLCYMTAPGNYTPCQKVEPACPNVGGAGGASAAPPPSPDLGMGGISSKIALPPRQLCTCTAGTWACTFGI
jgi:hypothetical protein